MAAVLLRGVLLYYVLIAAKYWRGGVELWAVFEVYLGLVGLWPLVLYDGLFRFYMVGNGGVFRVVFSYFIVAVHGPRGGHFGTRVSSFLGIAGDATAKVGLYRFMNYYDCGIAFFYCGWIVVHGAGFMVFLGIVGDWPLMLSGSPSLRLVLALSLAWLFRFDLLLARWGAAKTTPAPGLRPAAGARQLQGPAI